MPTYEYQCQDCGHRLEAIQRMSDDPLTECPACGKAALKRLISGGFINVGGGRKGGGTSASKSTAEHILARAHKDAKSKTCAKQAKSADAKRSIT